MSSNLVDWVEENYIWLQGGMETKIKWTTTITEHILCMCLGQGHYVFLTIISILTTCLRVGYYFHFRKKEMKTQEGRKLAQDSQ